MTLLLRICDLYALPLLLIADKRDSVLQQRFLCKSNQFCQRHSNTNFAKENRNKFDSFASLCGLDTGKKIQPSGGYAGKSKFLLLVIINSLIWESSINRILISGRRMGRKRIGKSERTIANS